jgi:iron complex outermembrane receptor protein
MRLILLSVLINNSVWAQTAQKIKLIDKSNSEPIADVAYQYGESKGTSNMEGVIEIIFLKGEKLYLSHLNFGSLSFSEDEVSEFFLGGQVLLVPQIINLQPVNIIALHLNDSKQDNMAIEGKDFLTHDAASILTSLPEIAVIRKSGSYGFDPVLRGFKYEQLNIIIDGAQTAIAACPNRMDPPASQIAPNMMGQVEILKGPYNLRYGSNFGGTINFITTKAQYQPSSKLTGRVSTGYESNGNIMRAEGMIGHLGPKYNVKLFGSFSKGANYLDGNGDEIPSSFQRASFGTKMGFKPTERQSLNLSVNGNFARDVDFAALNMDLRSDDTWLVQLDHQIEFNSNNLKNWTTNVYGSFVNHVMDNLSKPLDPRMVNAITDATTKTMGGRTEGFFKYSSSKLYVGADYKFETANGERARQFLMGPNAGRTLYDNVWQDGQISKAGLFAEMTQSLNTWQLVFSTRLENNKASIDDSQPEFSGIYTSTSSNQFNLSMSLGLIKNWSKFSAGFWLGRAQRSGSLTERYINYFPVGVDAYEMLGNPILKAEVNNQIDLNLSYQSVSSKLSIEGFFSVLPNYISSVIRPDLSPRIPSSAGVRQYINIDNARLMGAELSWSQGLFLGLTQQLNLAYTVGQDLEIDQPLPEIAPFDLRYSLQGRYLKDKLKALASFRFVAEQSRISTEFGESITPSFTLVGLQLGYRFNSNIGLQASVDNLFDVAFYEHLNRPRPGSPPQPIYAPGRNIALTLTIDLE